MYVRFDDLRPGRIRSFSLDGYRSALVANRVDEVGDVLAGVESAVETGHWVAGWMAYEASPAFHSAYRVRPPEESQFGEMPLVWFGVFDRRVAVSERAAASYEIGPWESNVTAADHRGGVEEIKRRIEAGDTYQVNYTFRMCADFSGDGAAFYRDLIRSQRGGYGAYLDTGRWQVLSASPELFFEWEDGRLISKPMKGTAARGRDLREDLASSESLRSSEKDRAENVMIVDMVRNDLGRISRPGSVGVPVLFETEKYETVWQLTSTVEATTDEGTTLGDVFASLFPPASITGAPKVSTMSIVAELESDPRGVYCGAIGFGGPNQVGDPAWAFNVGIRTVVVDGEHGVAWYGTGGGITHGSEPSGEFEEALLKARVLGRRSSDFSLIETMRWSPGDGFHHLKSHIERLMASARYFDIPVEESDVEAALHHAAATHRGPRRIQLLVDRDGQAEVKISPAPGRTAHPLQVEVDNVPVDPSDPFLRHKTTRRETYERAAARHPTADDVILVNDRDEVTETTIANLAVEIEGRWLTPSVDSGCLPGVERQKLIEQGHVEETLIAVSDLNRASRLARFNSLRGWEPIVLAGAGLEAATG